ncbi:MAG: hypothetical protein GY801_14110 [bacterium]|nr:hypothetical protein [bacterium]
MSVIEIEAQIKPLSQAEKLQIIADVTRMLQENLLHQIPAESEIPYYSPFNEDVAAVQIHQYLEENS